MSDNQENVVTVTDAPVNEQVVSDQEQTDAANALGSNQQEALEKADGDNTVPLQEQEQTLNTGITLQPEVAGQKPNKKNKNNSAPPTDGQNINVDDFINDAEMEIGDVQAAKKARREKGVLLNKAVKSLNKVNNVQKKNVITGEIIAEYIEYGKDNDGKSVYDYMDDPFVNQHIAFVFPAGKKRGDKLKDPLTFYWKDATY